MVSGSITPRQCSVDEVLSFDIVLAFYHIFTSQSYYMQLSGENQAFSKRQRPVHSVCFLLRTCRFIIAIENLIQRSGRIVHPLPWYIRMGLPL